MKFHNGVAIFTILLFPSCLSKDIANCPYEDTMDMTNALKFPNGSYLYEGKHLIPPDEVDTYDYEIHLPDLQNKIPKAEHTRGCVCKYSTCVRFCCDPKMNEMLRDESNECMKIPNLITYDPYIYYKESNNSKENRNVLKDFTLQIGRMCEVYRKLPGLEDSPDTWTLHKNGSIFISMENNKSIEAERSTYCLTPSSLSNNDSNLVLIPVFCGTNAAEELRIRVPYIAMAVSIPFLIITFLIYIFIVELQNLHGKCFMSYIAALILGCITLCLLNLRDTSDSIEFVKTKMCKVVGYWGYFIFMSVFFWLNVISFDLWQSFRRTAPVRSTNNKRFLYYSAYAWGVPLCLTIIVIAIDSSNVESVYRPQIYKYCWIDTDKWSAMFYYFGINLAIVVIDIIFFGTTLYKIVSMKKDINKMMSRGGSKKNSKKQDDKYSFGLFFRLFLIMGVIWIFDVASFIDHMINPLSRNPFFYGADILNALVGPMIFIFFILNRKVLGLIKRRYQRFRGIVEKNQTETDVSTQLTS